MIVTILRLEQYYSKIHNCHWSNTLRSTFTCKDRIHSELRDMMAFGYLAIISFSFRVSSITLIIIVHALIGLY